MANILALTIRRHCARKPHTRKNTDHDVRMACNGVDALKVAVNPHDSRILASINMTKIEGITPVREQHRIPG